MMRYLCKLLAFAFLLCLTPRIPVAARQKTPSDSAQRRTQRPTWLKQGIVMVGSWEPVTFILRRGGQETNAREIWTAERTTESVRRLKELGINLVIGGLTGFVDDSIQFYFDFLSRDTAAEGRLC